jgi:hypothetical protein
MQSLNLDFKKDVVGGSIIEAQPTLSVGLKRDSAIRVEGDLDPLHDDSDNLFSAHRSPGYVPRAATTMSQASRFTHG